MLPIIHFQANFLKYGYKEAIEEGLKEEYDDEGRKLWAVMVSTFPNQFSGEYPDTDEARSLALKDFNPPNRIEKKHGPRRMHRYFWSTLKHLSLNFLSTETCYPS